VLTKLVGTEKSPDGEASAPILDTKQASTLVRVHDGTTIVMGGLIQTENLTNEKKIPLLGDIPGLGKLFTGTFKYKQKEELVMFVTPHIVREDETSAPLPPDKHPDKPAKY
jgi:type II secretory pathway component GspD/PulD (secretin)